MLSDGEKRRGKDTIIFCHGGCRRLLSLDANEPIYAQPALLGGSLSGMHAETALRDGIHGIESEIM